MEKLTDKQTMSLRNLFAITPVKKSLMPPMVKTGKEMLTKIKETKDE